jgi:hypothetical protein
MTQPQSTGMLVTSNATTPLVTTDFVQFFHFSFTFTESVSFSAHVLHFVGWNRSRSSLSRVSSPKLKLIFLELI